MTDMAQEQMDAVVERVLQPANLDLERAESLMGELATHNIDLGELYFQHQCAESWSLEDSLVKDASYVVDSGVGVRAVTGEKTGFAYAEDLSAESLREAVGAARSIARQGASQVTAVSSRAARAMYPAINPIDGLSEEAKVGFLSGLDAYTRGIDQRVAEVQLQITAKHESILVLATDGTLSADYRPLIRLNVMVIVDSNGRRERGFAGAGGRMAFDELLPQGEELAREAVRGALVNLDALDAPAGPMTVVLGPGWPGVLLHEAVGHGLEGDFNRKGTSAFAGMVGEQVASEHCTVIDDGAMYGRRGSLSVDDEGVVTTETVLIENGVLKGYMQDKMNARLMGVSSTGNGRRESYAHLPMPRMTNTYLQNGEYSAEEILSSVDNGVYAVNFGGGQVDITSGQFVFSATEAYLIRNGKVTEPIRGATLIGNGPDVMQKVSMVGNDMAIDRGVGVCGKDGQSVPVGVGQPTLKIDEVIVGGTQA